jgi:hypothetical protein
MVLKGNATKPEQLFAGVVVSCRCHANCDEWRQVMECRSEAIIAGIIYRKSTNRALRQLIHFAGVRGVDEAQAKRTRKVIVVTSVMLSFISCWRAAAIVLNDLGSLAYYVGGIAEQAVGRAAEPWSKLRTFR